MQLPSLHSHPGVQATSSLDEVNQKLVVDALSALMKGEHGGDHSAGCPVMSTLYAYSLTHSLTRSLPFSLRPDMYHHCAPAVHVSRRE